MTESIAETVSQLVYEEYSKLRPVCRPSTRSNGVKEWTVLASIVAIRTHTDELEARIISLATGVKALPDSYLARSWGKMLHDCHAEILAIRGLNSVLLEHIANLEAGTNSDLIYRCTTDPDLFLCKPEWKLALYVSRLPCGDCSMDFLHETANIHGQDQLDISDDDPYQFVDPSNHSIIRGRLNYKRLGIVRTKPGRYDSEMTLSKSCSDKLCIKQVSSLLNCLTWSLFKEKVFLDYLVIPRLTAQDKSSLERSFKQRLQGCNHATHYFKILSCTEPFVDDDNRCSTGIDSSPAVMSSIKLYYYYKDNNDNNNNNSNNDKKRTVEQAILNGLRNGFYTKGSGPLRAGSETPISRAAQWAKYLSLERTEVYNGHQTRGSYLEYKNSLVDRRQVIEDVKTYLAPAGWIRTFRDDC